jgi:hypothetical protein
MYGITTLLQHDYLLVEEKSIVPQMVHYFVNEHFMHRSAEQRKEFIEWMNEAFQQNLSANELVIKAIKQFLKIHPSQIFPFTQDISQLSWRQITKKIQDLRKKGEPNEEINDNESSANT